MASPFDPLLDRVTQRLQIDPELQLEVAHELRTHLEESAKEFRAAGRSEDDAIIEASRALGSEEELSEQLWQANRRRMRTRKIARWAIGATLVPGASVIAISVTWTTLLSFALLLSIVSYGTTPSSGLIGLAARHAADRVRANIPQEERDLAQNEGDINARIARADTILQRAPNDPAAYANYALSQLVKLGPSGTAPDLGRLLTVLDRGEVLEPANALYPTLESAVLFEDSTKTDSTANDRFDYRDPNGSGPVFVVPRYTITNRKEFDAALAAFRSASHKKYFDAHTMDAAKRQLDLLPSNSLDGQLLRISLACQILLPHVPKTRDLYDHLGAVVLSAASENDRKSAMDWIDAERRVADMAIERSDVLVELISAARLKEATVGQTALVLEKLGDHTGFDRERDRMIAMEAGVQPRIFAPTSAAELPEKFLSLSDRYFLAASTDVAKINLSAHRDAEYALFDQVSLTIGLLALLIVIGLQLLIAIGTSIRRSERPTLYFIGWRRVIKIVAVAIILPAGAYLAYAWSPISGRIYGAPALAGVLVVEYSLVGLIMFSILRVLFDTALRERSAELGLDTANTPAAPSATWRYAELMLGVIAFAYIAIERWYIATHNVGGKFSASMGIGFAISICIWMFDLVTLLVGTHTTRADSRNLIELCALLLIVAAIGIGLFFKGLEAFAAVGVVAVMIAIVVIAISRWLRAKRENLPEISWRLAIVPLELLTVLILAILVLPLLQMTERCATNQFQRPVPYLTNEIENSQYHDLRTQLLQDIVPAAREAS